jgi:hypothetical protein
MIDLLEGLFDDSDNIIKWKYVEKESFASAMEGFGQSLSAEEIITLSFAYLGIVENRLNCVILCFDPLGNGETIEISVIYDNLDMFAKPKRYIDKQTYHNCSNESVLEKIVFDISIIVKSLEQMAKLNNIIKK